MIHKIISCCAITTALLLSGCGSSDGESKLETQQMLDDGDFAGVISKLESNANSKEDYIALASAYMGKAGFSLSSIIGLVSDNANANGGDEFSSFVNSTSSRASYKSIGELSKAGDFYKKVLKNKCDGLSKDLSSGEKDLCVFYGLSKVSQTAVTITELSEDTSKLVESGTDDKLAASACALQYAFNGTTTVGCSVVANPNVTFTQSNRTYRNVDVTYSGKTFGYLLTTTTPGSTVMTHGQCKLDDFSTRTTDVVTISGFYPCPIVESNTTADLQTGQVLVDALNNGSTSIKAAAPEDVKEDIDKFLEEVLEANGRSIHDSNTTVTVSDIVKYLDTKNQ